MIHLSSTYWCQDTVLVQKEVFNLPKIELNTSKIYKKINKFKQLKSVVDIEDMTVNLNLNGLLKTYLDKFISEGIMKPVSDNNFLPDQDYYNQDIKDQITLSQPTLFDTLSNSEFNNNFEFSNNFG
jgi:hypothetical protein